MLGDEYQEFELELGALVPKTVALERFDVFFTR